MAAENHFANGWKFGQGGTHGLDRNGGGKLNDRTTEDLVRLSGLDSNDAHRTMVRSNSHTSRSSFTGLPRRPS